MLAEIIYVGTHEKAPKPPASWRRRLKSITGYFYSFLSEYFEDTSSPFRGLILPSFILKTAFDATEDTEITEKPRDFKTNCKTRLVRLTVFSTYLIPSESSVNSVANCFF